MTRDKSSLMPAGIPPSKSARIRDVLPRAEAPAAVAVAPWNTCLPPLASILQPIDLCVFT